MKKIAKILIIWLLMVNLISCTIHLPSDWIDEENGIRVILLVEPDDALVILNGRFIGEAYEFSTPGSALRLNSRNNELVIRKKGYTEETIDLHAYTSRKITVRLKMSKEKEEGLPKEKKGAEYKPKTEPVKEIPKTLPEQKSTAVATLIHLTVNPAEAAIYINGRFWGISPEDGKIDNLRLNPGKYTFEVFKPGYKTLIRKVNIPKQEKFSIQLVLKKIK
jgi:hypothetical protein